MCKTLIIERRTYLVPCGYHALQHTTLIFPLSSAPTPGRECRGCDAELALSGRLATPLLSGSARPSATFVFDPRRCDIFVLLGYLLL